MKISQKAQREKAFNLLEAVGLANRLQHKPKELSIGEMQRVTIARALVNNPSLLLADEPTGELDSKTGSEIITLLSDLCKKQKTAVIVATHDKKIIKVANTKYGVHDGVITKMV
jgi:putative ABC transport system ATP-binding protein